MLDTNDTEVTKVPRKFVTVSDELWHELKLVCLRRRINLPQALREALEQYLATQK
jgi:hypothetical protein